MVDAVSRWSTRFLAPAATVLVLAGLAYSLDHRRAPENVAAAHAAVRAAALDLPTLIEQWYGRDTPVPVEAVQVLQPNVLISRQYRNLRTGETFDLLLVHSGDARNMENHYPAHCYPVNGWKRQWMEPRQWHAGRWDMPIMEYGFRSDRMDQIQQIIVTNVILLPTGDFSRDMSKVYPLSADPFMRHYGAGQIHLIFSPSTSESRRQEIFDQVVTAASQSIAAMLGEGEFHAQHTR